MGDLSHHIAASDTRLLGALSFDHPTTCNYITARRSCRSYTTGASAFKPSNGGKVARITISADEWLDTSSLQICFKLTNLGSVPLTPAGDATLFVDRMRIFLAGTLCEDINFFSRVSQVIKAFTPWSARANQEVEQFALLQNGTALADQERCGQAEIAPGGTFTFAMRPHACGLLSLNRFLPLRWAPVTIELYLSQPSDGVVVPSGGAVPNYEFTEIYIQHDLISLDQNMSNSYYKEIESGRALTLSMPVVHCVQNILPAGQVNTHIPIVRSFTRLNSIFCVFSGPSATGPEDMLYPSPGFKTRLANGGVNTLDDTLALRWQWSLGSRLFPEMKVDSVQQTWSSLVQAVGMSGQDVKSLSLSGFQFLSDRFILGQSFQRVPGVFASGICTRSGDLARLTLENLSPGYVDTCYALLCADQIIEITSLGVSVFD